MMGVELDCDAVTGVGWVVILRFRCLQTEIVVVRRGGGGWREEWRREGWVCGLRAKSYGARAEVGGCADGGWGWSRGWSVVAGAERDKFFRAKTVRGVGCNFKTGSCGTRCGKQGERRGGGDM